MTQWNCQQIPQHTAIVEKSQVQEVENKVAERVTTLKFNSYLRIATSGGQQDDWVCVYVCVAAAQALVGG